MIAYITQQGAKVIRQGRRLLVQTDTNTHTLFCWKLEQVFVFGNVTLTQPALALLLDEGIDIAFFRADGRYLGRFAHDEPKNVFLRKKQFLLTNDESFCLAVAKNIVTGKLQNQATLLARIKRTKNKAEAGESSKTLREYARTVEHAENIAKVRGIEGLGAAVYFAALPLGFQQDWGFNKRVRRPPTDPVNAVLSLCYTLLINRMSAAVRQAHLDPYPAVLHSLEYGRQSLPLDLVEEFRSLVADTLTLSLFNMKVLDWGDFEIVKPTELEQDKALDPLEKAVNDPLGKMNMTELADIADIKGEQIPSETDRPTKLPVLLTPPAFRRVLTAFSKKMDSTFYHPLEEREMSYTDAMFAQAKQYRKVIEGERQEYQPLLLR